jgi:hypothetical protein
MLLTQTEIDESRTLAARAFPGFAYWEWVNEINDCYAGFCIWGRCTPELEGALAPSFFVTFSTFQQTWRGHLTVGQHCYFWSSADVGDAHLLDTAECATLSEAITAMKSQLAGLFAALRGSRAGQRAERLAARLRELGVDPDA